MKSELSSVVVQRTWVMVRVCGASAQRRREASRAVVAVVVVVEEVVAGTWRYSTSTERALMCASTARPPALRPSALRPPA